MSFDICLKPARWGLNMELSASAVTGAMRIGVQVISALKRPSVEVFSQLRATSRPMKFGGAGGMKEEMDGDESFVAFYAANIGGRHAENVTFDMSKTKFERPSPMRWGDRINAVVPVMSPGQSQFLFLLNAHEFNRMKWEGSTGTPVGWKDEPINIVVRFDGPSGLTNGIQRWFWNKLLKRKQYEFRYSFNPLTLVGDLPPREYL